jgi:large repetitive protein
MQHARETPRPGAVVDAQGTIPHAAARGPAASARLCTYGALLALGCAACASRAEPETGPGANMPRLVTGGPRWATTIDGSDVAEGAAIAVLSRDAPEDAPEAAIVAGSFTGDLAAGGQRLASAGDSDAFLARLDAQGKTAWLLRMGGPGMDRASSVAASADRIALGLQITPPVDIGGQIITGSGQPEAVLVALAPDGAVAWIQPIHSSRYARIAGITVSGDGAVTIVGSFAGTVRVGERSLTSAGATDVLVARFGAGGAPAWALRLGGPGADSAHGLAAWGTRLAMVGHFDGNVDLGQAYLQAPSAFVAALEADGRLQWVRTPGAQTTLQAVAADADAVYVAGHFQGTVQLGEESLDSHGQSDVFLGRLDHQGAPVWLRQLGGPGMDHARALAVTPRGPILGGTFEHELAIGDRELASAGASDGFAAELDRETGALTQARRLGGPGYDDLASLAAGAEVLVMTGSFEGTADLDGRALTAHGSRGAFAIGLDL